MRVLIYVLVGIPLFELAKYISETFYSGFLAGVVVCVIWSIIDKYKYPSE